MSDKEPTPECRPAYFTIDDHCELAISEVLKQVDDSKQWHGIAHTTSGARAIIRMTAQELIDSSKKSVDPNSVYEFRLWRVGTGDDRLLAQEIRWVAGVGCAELSLYDADDCRRGAPTYWSRPNKYLQHSSSRLSDAHAPEMTSYEIFTVDDEYGNVIFVDELMTGEWT